MNTLRDRVTADPNKIQVEVAFCFDEAQRAQVKICGHKVNSLFTTGYVMTQRFKTTMTNRKMGRSGTVMCLLSNEQMDLLFEEGDGPFEAREQVEELFTFQMRRTCGCHWVEFTWGEPKGRQPSEVTITTEEQVECNRYVLTQLIRFGVLDKLPPAKE